MTIAHTLAAPAPTSRWLLLGSLALNLFLIGLAFRPGRGGACKPLRSRCCARAATPW